jgi:aerobic-type carbon monoxide dehydrogenase small subunit (CoxS/CutS family)
MAKVTRLVKLKVNGEERPTAVATHHTLVEVLRYQLSLTGTKQGCDKGDCGACTVIMDGEAVLSCITLAVAAEHREVTTIEGLKRGQHLDPVQDAFDRCGALQCGFCQSGMMMTARALLNHNPTPNIHEVRTALAGNLCRCTGYTKVLEAVLLAATAGQDVEAAYQQVRAAGIVQAPFPTPPLGGGR